MTVAVCTLFEKDYHHGVAALVNSLTRNGYSGKVYAGFRGELPHWTGTAPVAALGRWPAAKVLKVSAQCELVFLKLETAAHFTNIKPDFMLDLFAEQALSLQHLLYLDPDICLAGPWQFIQDWMSCGIALCEDVNSPLGEHHPRRIGWRRYFGDRGFSLTFRGPEYVNGGCVGVARQDRVFLENWRALTTAMTGVIGGLDTAKIQGGAVFQATGFASCFDCSDQDALNAAVEMTRGVTCSVLPQPAMAFARGAAVLPHALGRRKPWRRRYLREALAALPPTMADKTFWQMAEGPLKSMPAFRLQLTRLALRIAQVMGRFYARR